MLRTRRIASWTAALALAAAAGIAGGVVATSGARAAKPVAQLDVSFAPVVVESRAVSRAYLAIRNFGTAASTLGLGDQIDLTFSTGASPADIAFTGSVLAPLGLPDELHADPLPESRGLRLVVQSSLAVAPGATLLLPFDFASGEAGVAAVTMDLRLAKPAGKYPKRVEARVAKTPPRTDLFFGDGHDGDLTVTADMEIPNTATFSYANVSIATEGRLTVPSGATIRCTGTFTNLGTIVVRPGASGGSVRRDAVYEPEASGLVFDPAKQTTPPFQVADRGEALTAPTFPAVMVADTTAPGLAQASSGALGGTGLGTRVRRLPLASFRTGGGGGTGAFGAVGGDGGGLLRVIARGALVNSGTITADGTVPTTDRAGYLGGGAGGGGGGIVILASASSVDNTGKIHARGANGGPPDGYGGGGGGGGGGYIALVAPQITGSGDAAISAGQGYLHSGNVSQYRAIPANFLALWCGGGGGGGCAGSGGDGHGVNSAGVLDGIVDTQSAPIVPRAAGDGDVVHVVADPRTVW